LVERSERAVVVSLPRFRLRVLSGPDAKREAVSQGGQAVVGTADGATLRLTDPTVSRFHFEVRASSEGLVVRDLGSTNGTSLEGVKLREVVVSRDIELSLGRTRVRLIVERQRDAHEGPSDSAFGPLLGHSAAMRLVFDTLQRAAPTTAPVLLTGESGTGKELAARAVHAHSPRHAGPYEVVDCGGLPATLIESELFGHERGAFTGAVGERMGAFERAEGGTLFLDELGELPLELQPKLLRVLGEGEIRRLGGQQTRRVDVRVVAATNRDLRQQVNAGQFRPDLYYRLAVISVRMPALRDRLEDLSLRVPALLAGIAEQRGLALHIEADPELLATLARHSWPGNVRELRNYLEQLLILRVPPTLPIPTPPADGADQSDLALRKLPLRQAKAELLDRFEREYVAALLDQTSGNVAEAARRAGIDRVTLFRTIRRHGLGS
jgi:DNA-binding NtrC family response regulator